MIRRRRPVWVTRGFIPIGEALSESTSKNVAEQDLTHADIGLVCALPMELRDFVARWTKVKTYTGGTFTFRGGFFHGIRIAMVESGMGQERARRATHALIDAHSPRWIVSTGFCGALIPEMSIGHIVVANKIRTESSDELSVDIGMSNDTMRGLHVGRTLTVGHMVRTIAEKRELAQKASAIAVDMETYAVASVCHERKTRFMAVRAASDDISADIPAEVLSLVGDTGAVRVGAVLGALWKRPASYKDMWRIREQAMLAGERLATFLDGVVRQLHSSP